jgi:hypothetical protein
MEDFNVDAYIDEQIETGDDYVTKVFIVIEGGVVQDARITDSNGEIHIIDLDAAEESGSLEDAVTVWSWPDTQA